MEAISGLSKTIKSVEHLVSTENETNPPQINIRQCELLAKKASGALLVLQALPSQELAVDGPTLSRNWTQAALELHRVLKDAEIIVRDCCCDGQWLRFAIKRGNLHKTFAKLLYDIEWHTSVLCSALTTKSGRSDAFEKSTCEEKLGVTEGSMLASAAKQDRESLRHLLKHSHVCGAEVCKQSCLAVKLLANLDAEEEELDVSKPPSLLWVDSRDLKKGQGIGKGSFAEVKKTTWLGQSFAIKLFLGGTIRSDDFRREIAVMAGLDHPHVVRVVCCLEDRQNLGIVMELMYKSLYDLLRELMSMGDHASPFPIIQSVDMMLQIAEGVRYLHSKSLAHRDLKSLNILVQFADPQATTDSLDTVHFTNGAGPFVAKIADFGTTKMKHASTVMGHQTLMTGTKAWMAPEVFKDGEIDPSARFHPMKVDVYSFGIMCSEILTGEEPYDFAIQFQSREFYKRVKDGSLRPKLPKEIPTRLAVMIQRCWDRNPRRRPDFPAICTELRYIKGLLLQGNDLALKDTTVAIGPVFDLKPEIKFYSGDVESKIGSNRINNPFHLYQPVDLVDLHQELFTASASFVSYRKQPSLEIIMTTAAAFSKLHDETLARDLEQIVNDNAPINKSGVSNIFLKISDIYGWITNSNAPKRISNMPITLPFSLQKTRNLLSLCMEEVQKSAKHFSSKGASGAYVMNGNQCYLLVHVLQETERTLARVFQLQPLEVHPISVLGELLLTLHEAHTLINANCITRSESQWLREAFEQGDMSHTFSQVLYNVIWHSCVLWDMVACDNCTRESYQLSFKCKGQSGRREALEVLLSEAVEKDEKSLKHRLQSMKVVDPMNQGLVHQFLDRMEVPSSNLVFLNLDDFDVKGAPHIGSGSYGAVVKYNFLGRQCAMKVIKGIHGHEGDFEKEIDAAKKLGNHPNLVRLHCYSKTKVACYLVMEELQMDLSKVLQLKNKNGKGLSIVEAVALMLQIGEGLKHIHDKGAAHRDLKPGNILVNLANPSSNYLSRICSVKIADFGLTKTQAAVLTYSNHTKNKGTSSYMAPEVMKSDTNGLGSTRFNPAKADIFSFGVVCSEILTGEAPYVGIMPKQFKKQVKAGTLRPNLPTNCLPRLTTLITRCWDGDYKKRPLLPEVCGELRYIKRLLLMYMDGARHKTSRLL